MAKKTLMVTSLCLVAGLVFLWPRLQDGLPSRPLADLISIAAKAQTGPPVDRDTDLAPYAKPIVIDGTWIKHHSGPVPDFGRPLFTGQGAVVCPTVSALRRLLAETRGGQSGTFSDLGCGVMPGPYPVTVVWQRPGDPAVVSVLIHIGVDAIGNAAQDLPVQVWTAASMLRN
jgi:hypothetical protein